MFEDIGTTKMSSRGQIIIPKDIRDYVHASKDTIFTVSTLDEDTIIMKKMDKKKLIAEFRAIRQRVKRISNKEIQNEIKATRKSYH